MAVAAIGTFAAYRGAAGGPSHHFVVAARDVPSGTVITTADLTQAAVDLPPDVAGRSFEVGSTVAGRITVAPIARGELVQASAVVDASRAASRYQMSLPIERARALDGVISPGERVDVLSTYGTGSSSSTIVVARGAEVVRVNDGRKAGIGGTSADIVLVLALPTSEEVLAVTHASQAGKITLVRATGAPPSASPGADSYQPPLDPGAAAGDQATTGGG